MMTPQEVANCTFAKAAIGGYHMSSVDDFLDKLTEDYSALYKENAALKAKLKVMVDKMAEYREVEDAMRATLLTAQKMANSMVAEAEQKRDAMIANATAVAQARKDELAREIAAEERRVAEVRQRVDRELQMERVRLTRGQESLRAFIREVTAVCNEELETLNRLPELPAEPEVEQPSATVATAPTAAAAPTVQTPPVSAQPQPPPAQPPELNMPAAAEPPQPPEPQEAPQKAVAAFAGAQGKGAALREPPKGDPFVDDSSRPDDVDMAPTRVLNLEDLQFGRNYSRD